MIRKRLWPWKLFLLCPELENQLELWNSWQRWHHTHPEAWENAEYTQTTGQWKNKTTNRGTCREVGGWEVQWLWTEEGKYCGCMQMQDGKWRLSSSAGSFDDICMIYEWLPLVVKSSPGDMSVMIWRNTQSCLSGPGDGMEGDTRGRFPVMGGCLVGCRDLTRQTNPGLGRPELGEKWMCWVCGLESTVPCCVAQAVSAHTISWSA